MLLRSLVVLTGAIIGYQLFIPPIVGLADQGDFVRLIGRFGYGQDPPSPRWKYVYVPPKFVPTNFRVREWEQPTSEYLFVGIALLLNRVVSKDGSLSILLIGSVHALFFLLIYARLLRVTQDFEGHRWLWVAATLVLTDVGYVAYWNSFYREPASLLFALALLAQTIAICRSEYPSTAAIVRWVIWSVLFVTAKEQNTALALLLVIFLLRLRTWSACRRCRRVAVLGVLLILTSGVLNVVTSPLPEHQAAAYNVLFLSILPESGNPSADLQWFGLSPRLAEYSGKNTWSVNTGFNDPELQRSIGRTL
ncbi:MAG: hypothetical protein JOZ22_09155, partial [Acidobacteriia bacterium]|nr:hypothetical protein [Terriglobia bacterium]